MKKSAASSHTEDRGLTLCCFSPPVMLATMLIESVLAIYVFVRYHRGAFGKLSTILIMLLGFFQLSEYQVCGNQYPQFWSRFGLVAITILPIIGLRLISFVTKKRRFLVVGYILTAVLALIFIFNPHSITESFCGGNYVIFSGPTALYQFFGAYYFVFLIFAIWELLETMRKNKNQFIRKILQWFVIGYLSFMAPMGIVYAFYAPARSAVASIMCGFAVILAIIVAFRIVPEYYRYIYRKSEL